MSPASFFDFVLHSSLSLTVPWPHLLCNCPPSLSLCLVYLFSDFGMSTS
jgi:hypothetical protein